MLRNASCFPLVYSRARNERKRTESGRISCLFSGRRWFFQFSFLYANRRRSLVKPMKNFSVQYLLSDVEQKKVTAPTSLADTQLASTVPVPDEIGKSDEWQALDLCLSVEDDHHSTASSSLYESSHEDEDDEQQTSNRNLHDSGTTSEDSETSKYLRQEHPSLAHPHPHHHHHETSKRRKRRVLFTKQQTFELERRFRQQRYLSGKQTNEREREEIPWTNWFVLPPISTRTWTSSKCH